MSRSSRRLLPTGVDRVGLAYIRRYGTNAYAVINHRGFARALSRDASQRVFESLLSGVRDRYSHYTRFLGAFDGWRNSRAPSSGVLLHTSHSGIEYPRYYAWMRKRNLRPVFMIHDLIPLTHPEYCRPNIDHEHRRRIHTAIRHAAGLITNSKATLDTLVAEAAQTNLTLPSCVVARLAPGIAHAPAAPALLSGPYFVVLGTIEPRKNHWLILHVWRRLVERLGDAAPKLVVVGRRGWECENVVDMLDRSAPLKNAVIEESHCDDARLHTLLQHARALLFPSFVEGYGMPLVEALVAQVPVIASDLPVFHEIATNIPDYLDPLDGPGWLARILAYTEADSPERAAQISRMADFRAPTWSEHFTHVDRFLDSLCQ